MWSVSQTAGEGDDPLKRLWPRNLFTEAVCLSPSVTEALSCVWTSDILAYNPAGGSHISRSRRNITQQRLRQWNAETRERERGVCCPFIIFNFTS